VHILLTDMLTCPRCGPAFGLILLADRMAGRRVLEGALGCSNCREKYPIRDGVALFSSRSPANAQAVADSAAAPAASLPASRGAPDPEASLRVAALLGVTQGPAYVLLAGPATVHAAQVGAMVEGVEVIAVAVGEAAAADDMEPAWTPADAAPSAPAAAVSRITVDDRLPLADARLSGVMLSGPTADALLEEGARVLSPLGRLVLQPAPADAAGRLAAAGLRVLLDDADTIVAMDRRTGGGS
jgi:uncharacterized protein YbaR (Trm112 family)